MNYTTKERRQSAPGSTSVIRLCRLLLLLNADQLDNLTVSFIPLLDIGNKEEVDSGEAYRWVE